MSRARSLALAALLLLPPVHAAGQATSSDPAALLMFPYVTVDRAAAVDTLVQITNAANLPVGVHCVYYDAASASASTAFAFRLTPRQPTAWRLGVGGDVGLEGGTIPPLTGATRHGVLDCFAVGDDGAPTGTDVLVGAATVEYGGEAAAVDAARYNALGLPVTEIGPDADDVLKLGGATGEYAGCPAAAALPVLLDGAIVAFGAGGTTEHVLSSTLIVATCSQAAAGVTVAVEIALTNEFGQQFTVTREVQSQLRVPFSAIDTNVPAQSFFNVASQGSASGTLRVTPADGAASGVVALALAAHTSADESRVHRAIIAPRLIAAFEGQEQIDTTLPAPACAGDCNANGAVAINELIVGVNIALGNQAPATCPAFDLNSNGSVAINELIAAVGRALSGCEG
ncbi:MAG: hypothetical protein ACRERC_25965 [Candidatus Binatia bacterium]